MDGLSSKDKVGWSIPGEKTPLWANRLGWALVLGTFVMLFVFVRMTTNGYLLFLIYSVISGILVSVCSFMTKSKIMLAFGIILFFLYLIAVIILGVNTP